MASGENVASYARWRIYPIPVVGFVGVSGSGKTTFLERVIAELTSRGWRVGTAKHHHRPEFEIDVPGKDSWRHAHAGAVVSMISSEQKLGVTWKLQRERSVAELVAIAGDAVDILLTESIRDPESPQIEVVRRVHSDRVTCPLDSLFALVTDGSFPVGDVPVFALDDVSGVTDLIESSLLLGGRVRDSGTVGMGKAQSGGSNRV